MRRPDAFLYTAVALLVVLALAASVSLRTFRIPSDSMMPTLLDGDVVLVNQAAYGLPLPFSPKRFLAGSPQRGDVAVFRSPRNQSVYDIKRVIGLPGDHVELRSGQLFVNGAEAPMSGADVYNDGCYIDMQRASEQLGRRSHELLFCPVPLQVSPVLPPSCDRPQAHAYICSQDPDAATESLTAVTDEVVPPGHYFLIGDNRDNSEDSRVYGPVPAQSLAGKAVLIGFSWDPERRGGPRWSRIGKAIP